MKRSVLRIGCAVLSLSAAAGLLASCSLLPPASPLPDSKPAQAEEAPGTAAASLDDGKLRILYSNGSNGGNTVLCGNTVLYQAASSETVYLVPDTLTGTVRYYLRQWSAPGTPTGRATALCDRSGKEILTFDRAYDAVLTGSLLVLTAPEQMAYAPCNNHCRRLPVDRPCHGRRAGCARKRLRMQHSRQLSGLCSLQCPGRLCAGKRMGR